VASSVDVKPPRETLPDGTLVLDSPARLPEVLDILMVGGGPFGTAVAFRAKELGLDALVIDHDDLMKRIRDYAKDKQILPDYGGGDRMQFPEGGELITQLRFDPIDKDVMCTTWKGLYRRLSVPAQVGVEMIGLEPDGATWRVKTWNHNTKAEQVFRAKHVVLGMGRGVPRQIEVTGDVRGMAFGLRDASKYVGEPVCVIGGGTSAAEAVIAISNAKASATDASAVYWSYRGDKLPKVSKALADVFFDAFLGNGNVRYLPNSEPLAVIGEGEQARLSIRTARVDVAGQPVQTTHLEFRKHLCVACIGEDIPEELLT
jgi:thioredoxin reductase